jgi:hypothetical protein
MYKKTVNLDENNLGQDLFSEIEDGEVYQIIQKGKDVKVLMTQEYYFQLMAKLEKADGSTRVTTYDSEQLMSDFEKKVKNMYKTTEEQKIKLYKIAANMKKFGIDTCFIADAVKIGEIYEGAYDLFCLWADEKDDLEKKNIISELQKEINEYKEQPEKLIYKKINKC